MSRIPGSEEWDAAVVSARVDFLVMCARRARELAGIMSRPRSEAPGRNPPRPRDEASFEPGAAHESWADAAALAFCTDGTATGLGFLRETVETGYWNSSGLVSLTREALFGALTGTLLVRVFANEIELRVGRSEAFRFHVHELGTAIELARALPILVFASALSGRLDFYAPILEAREGGGISRVVRLAALESPELSVLGLFDYGERRSEDFSPSVDSARAALLQMEERWETRLAMMRRDAYHWSRARSRTELIDWRLLAIHVALRRHAQADAAGSVPGPASAFLRDLAREIDELTPIG
jgi:hypothetical protein